MTENDTPLLSAADYRPVPRARLMRTAAAVATVALLVAGCGGVFLKSPPTAILFTLPAGFMTGLAAHAHTAREENLQRKANSNVFVVAVLLLMVFMGYVPLVWKQQGWSESLRVVHAASNVAVQVLLFVAFFRQPYRRTAPQDRGGKA